MSSHVLNSIYGSDMVQCDYIACIDWMWYIDAWIPLRIIFKSTFDHNETIIVAPSQESLKKFTYMDVLKNLKVFPHKGFQDDNTIFGTIQTVPLTELNKYIPGEFYNQYLKQPDAWDSIIGTFDIATFNYLEPLLSNKIVYLGEGIGADALIQRHLQSYIKWKESPNENV